MKFGSVCSGIEAASLAWGRRGWKAAWFSEIEAFPSAVLKHHHPEVPNLGDMTKIHEREEFANASIDVLVGGTPCQPFSVAGLRKGMADPRGNLALHFLAIADRARPRWVVWENVPGVLSSNKGRDFGSFLGGLGELGYGFAYRVLDAQYFRVAQRRRRVFVVGYLGDWRNSAAVLFERACLSGNPPPRREAGQKSAGTLSARTRGGGGLGTDFELDGGLIPEISPALKARDYKGPSSDGGGDGAPIIVHPKPIAFDARQSDVLIYGDKTGPVDTCGSSIAVFDPNQITHPDNRSRCEPGLSHALPAQGSPPIAFGGGGVRRLTPEECERLQGFPDGYTSIPVKGAKKKRAGKNYADIDGKLWQLSPDGPRYRAIGNSMAVPVMEWIGRQIESVELSQISLQRGSGA